MTVPTPAVGADSALATRAGALIVDVADFPTPGVLFKDLTPVLGDPATFADIVAWMAAATTDGPIEAVAGIEARGFVLGAPVALALAVPFVPVRKAGRLPRTVYEESYALEYGEACLAIHTDAPVEGRRVLIVDDVLATGGTAAAACRLVERAGGVPAGLAVLLELTFLPGRARLSPLPVAALLAT